MSDIPLAAAAAIPSSASPDPAGHNLWLTRGLLLASLAAALLFVFAIALTGPMKDDIAWLLYVAQCWMHGSRLYVDIVEVNPPLIVWIYAAPEWLVETFKLDPRYATMPFFAAIVLGCAAWTGLIVRKARDPWADWVVVFAVSALVLVLIPNVEFGQREHLLIATALPYLAVVSRELMDDEPGLACSVAAAIVAALGCALKPRYVVAFGAVEIYCLTQGLRLFRPAPIVAAATLALYCLLIFALEPAFFREAVPMAFALYGASDVPLLDLLFDCRLLLVALAAGAVVLTTQPVRGPRGRIVAALFIFAVATTAECIFQGKNWFYHRIPGTTAAVLCIVAWAALRLRGDWRPGWRLYGPALFAAVAVASIGLHAYEGLSDEMTVASRSRDTTVERLATLIRRENAHSYMAFTDWIGLGFPVVNETGVVWASRFDSMWALDGEVWRKAQDGHAPAEFPIGRWMSADFRHACPDIVVVDQRAALDYIGLLGQADPAFTTLWRRYERIASFNGLTVFHIKPPPLSHGPRRTTRGAIVAPLALDDCAKPTLQARR